MPRGWWPDGIDSPRWSAYQAELDVLADAVRAQHSASLIPPPEHPQLSWLD